VAPATSPPAGERPEHSAEQSPEQSQGSWFERMIDTITNLPGAFFGYVADALNGLVASMIRPVFDLLGTVVFSTPDLAGSGQVLKLWGLGLALTDLSLVVVVLARAHGVAWGGILESIRAKEGLEGLVLGIIGAHVSLGAVAVATKLSNALAAVFVDSGVNQATVRARELLTLGVAPFSGLLLLVALVMAILVPIMSIVRIAVLATLAVVGGPANIAFGLPATEGLARGWWRALLILELVPVAQAIVFSLGFGLFFGDTPIWDLHSLGWNLIEPLVLIVLLWLLFRIPATALRAAAAPLHGTYAGIKAKGRMLVMAAMLGRVPGATGVALRRVGGGAAAGRGAARRAAAGRSAAGRGARPR
jgi:hypothetical protein